MGATAPVLTPSSGPWCAGAPRSSGWSSSGSATAGAVRWRRTRCRWTSRPCGASCRSGRSGIARIKDNLAGLGVDALIAIGGEDTLGVATRLHAEGIPVIGVPKTIDNDLGATDYTFGFDTAVNIAMEAIDRLHTTAESHHRALIVEVMGRHAGWIALHAGLAGGANVILIPERPFDMDKVVGYVEHRFQTRYAPIVVVAEGAHPGGEDLALTTGALDAFGHVSCSRLRSRSAPARKRAARCSVTSSAAARRPLTTGCWRPALA